MTKSILALENVELILAAAKDNLKRDKFLQPILFMHLTTGERLMAPVELSGTTTEKVRYLNRIGFSLWQQGKAVAEAILLAEGWFVALKEPTTAYIVPPSQHPERREAIVLIGRNADRTKLTSVVQPFSRDEDDEPIWQTPEMTAFDTPPSEAMQLVGLLDYLFVQEPTKQSA